MERNFTRKRRGCRQVLCQGYCKRYKPQGSTAKSEGMLQYNDVRPLISAIPGVQDFEIFLMNGSASNICFGAEEYPKTGICNFSQA